MAHLNLLDQFCLSSVYYVDGIGKLRTGRAMFQIALRFLSGLCLFCWRNRKTMDGPKCLFCRLNWKTMDGSSFSQMAPRTWCQLWCVFILIRALDTCFLRCNKSWYTTDVLSNACVMHPPPPPPPPPPPHVSSFVMFVVFWYCLLDFTDDVVLGQLISSWTQSPPFCRRHFQMHFHEWKSNWQ